MKGVFLACYYTQYITQGDEWPYTGSKKHTLGFIGVQDNEEKLPINTFGTVYCPVNLCNAPWISLPPAERKIK